MSLWTHIVAVLHVDTYREVDDIQKYVEEALKNAPKITGSERDAEVFVNAEPGYCISVSCDCSRCKYKDTVKYHEDGYECDSPEGYECPHGEYQSRAIITVCGDLRDRTRDTTKEEWNAFCKYITKELKFDIRISSCKINGW